MATCEYCKNHVESGASVCGWCGKNPYGKTTAAAGIAGGGLFILLLPIIKWAVIATTIITLFGLKQGILRDMAAAASAAILITFNKRIPFPSRTPGLTVWWLLLIAQVFSAIQGLYK